MGRAAIQEEIGPIVDAVQAQGPFVLAIDIGTSAIRACVFDSLGRIVSGTLTRTSYPLHVHSPGAAEIHPDHLLNCLWTCIDLVMEKSQPLVGSFIGVATSTLVGNILGIDASGQAVTPVYTYADTRPETEVGRLRRELDNSAVHNRTGCPLAAGYLPARMRWLASHRPEEFARSNRWVSIGEYMHLKLFGECEVSYSVASWTGLLNLRELSWDAELLGYLPLSEEHLSPLVDINSPRSGLLPHFARRWPALAELPWFPALGDGAAANIGSGCLGPQRICLTMGSSTALRSTVPAPCEALPSGLWCYVIDAHRFLVGGALSEGGNLFRWAEDNLTLGKPQASESALASMEPDAHGLTILPFMAGERSTGWHGRARGTVHGITLSTSAQDILRAIMEAIAFRIAFIFDELAGFVPSNPQIIATGGALRHCHAWLQIIADVLGLPVVLSRVPEASSRGAALLALEALGAISDVKEVPDFLGPTYEPDHKCHRIYLRAMARQQELYEALVERGTLQDEPQA